MIHLQGLKFCKHAQGNFALTCKSSETSEWVEGIYLFRESSVEPGLVQFSSVQLFSRIWLFAIPWTAAHPTSLSITNSRSLLRLMSIESVIPFNHLTLCLPLLLLPSIFLSIRVLSQHQDPFNESVLPIRWPKNWSFSFNISPSNEYSGLISFRIDWLDLLAVRGTLKSLLQHHSSKASILQDSAFFIVWLSHLYMTTRKKP